MAGGGIKRIGGTGSRALSLNSRVAHQPSRQGLLKISNLNFPVVTPWVSYSPTLFGATNGLAFTNASVSGRWRRVADSVEMMVGIDFSGAPGTGTGNFRFTLPSGIQVDYSKTLTDFNTWTGNGYVHDSSSGNRWAIQLQPTPEFFSGIASLAPSLYEPSVTSTAVTATNPVTIAVNDRISFRATVPVSGWDANGTGSIEEIIESSFFNINAKNETVLSNLSLEGMANGSDLDVPGSAVFLESGRYSVSISGFLRVNASVLPTFGLGRLVLTNSANVAQTNNTFVGLGRVGTTDLASATASSAELNWPGGEAKLRTQISVTGGTVTSRDIFGVGAIIRKLS